MRLLFVTVYRRVVGTAFVLSTLAASFADAGEPAGAIEFNRDVRPILADHCFQCHGPDEKQRQGSLRLDTAEGAAADREGGPVVVAGQPEKSELLRRITSSNPDERMPPADKGRKLNEREVAVLRQWIGDGAKWQKHWSLLPITRPVAPNIKNAEAARNPIDSFIQARLEKAGLTPSPLADTNTVFRRATLSLTGLPPTLEEIEGFLGDRSPDAYERVVDRLLASPRYGERMASPWLDAARYADTSGYQSDGERFMWRWRDWVIDALNRNMPFDQFTIEQLAGDLLPQPTLDQQIATGFNRNHRGNSEGGIIPEEYAVEYVADRVETTATVWLGLTLGCCRCHDHKYDPFLQRDFYSLFAFFNNVPEKGRAIKIGNSPPYIVAPTDLQQAELARLERRAAAAEMEFAAFARAVEDAQIAWEKQVKPNELLDWQPDEDLVVSLPFDDGFCEQLSGSVAEWHGKPHGLQRGNVGNALVVDRNVWVSAGDVANFGFFDKFTIAAYVKVDAGDGGTVVSRMVDAAEGEGYQLAIVKGKLQFNLVKRWLDDALRVETAEPFPKGAWYHMAVTYDGSRVADGVKLYVDGQPQKLNVLLDELNQTFATKQPLRIGAGGGEEMRFRGGIDEVRIYRGALSPEVVSILAYPEAINAIVECPRERRGDARREKLKAYFLAHHAPTAVQEADRKRREAARDLAKFREVLPTVMVMEEMPAPRQSHILLRGQYDKPGPAVEPAVPAELPPLPAGAPRNRLGLAKWVVDPSNSLTSRVIVNRVWQTHFGTGLVKTAEDFGRQGEWPSHPELLDWLAAELQGRGQETGDRGQGGSRRWDMKRLHRVIVSSHTFRQSSRVTPELIARDPDNRLLARAPRLRLPAEMVRDQALFAGGQLMERLGGPSVRPVQPAGLWSELTGGEDYKSGAGADLVRRSLYTFWKRTIPPPTLATFDASTREFCSVRESRTNTPLQALALLNEPMYVDAARGLAERVMREAATPAKRIELAMLLVAGRKPTMDETHILSAALRRYGNGHADPPLAAYMLVCSTILNLDEAVTRQ